MYPPIIHLFHSV